jgi:glycosyltransferase involved in cell wall biosynthesis
MLPATAVPPPHLLQIVPSLDGGSLTRATLDAAQAAIAAGGSATVASAGGRMLPDLLRLHARHIELPQDRNPVWARLSLPARLVAGLRDVEVAIVLARTPATIWIARAVARRLKVKCIGLLHGPLVATSGIDRFVERRQGRADALVAVSAHVARDAVAHLPAAADRIDTIPPGINPDRFNPASVRADRVIKLAAELRVPDDCHIVICAARRERGRLTLIEALRVLGRNDVFCLMLGADPTPSPLDRELEQAIVRAGLAGRVQLAPHVEDMPAAYMLADLAVATGGAQRGYSRTLIEAQAMGRPVVAEDGGGAAELLEPGVTGWLATPADPASLAAAIDQALSLSDAQRAQLAHAAQQHVRGHYALAESNARLMALCQQLSGTGG